MLEAKTQPPKKTKRRRLSVLKERIESVGSEKRCLRYFCFWESIFLNKPMFEAKTQPPKKTKRRRLIVLKERTESVGI